MTVRLMESLATTEPLAEIFSDPSVLAAMLDFEAARARAEARLNVIRVRAAETIAAWAHAAAFDASALAREAGFCRSEFPRPFQPHKGVTACLS